jgi:4-amino-4-deoxy-L-arabinose transferase-like glycosyltransferase
MLRGRRIQFFLAALTVAMLAPFLNKAFHIDDPLFLWMARQIAQHPLDPYGFIVHWGTFPQPAFARIQNPPLGSYYMALVASFTGWSEPGLHTAFLVWPVLAVLGAFALARRILGDVASAVSVALLTLFTPVLLVSATSVMCDVMLLALWLWSIEFWLRGLAQDRWPWLLGSALLITATTFTKYFGIALVPLLAAYTIFSAMLVRPGASCRSVRTLARLLFLLVPIVLAIAFELCTRSLYGRGLFGDAVSYTRGVGRSSLFPQFMISLAFLGGAIFTPVLFLGRPPRPWLTSTLFLAVAGAGALLLPMTPDWQLGPNELPVRMEGGLFVAIGLSITALALADLRRHRTPESWLLFFWVLGTLVFVAELNWSITARTVLPAVPAVAILLARRWTIRKWQVAAAAAVSLVVTVADVTEANSVREAVHTFAQRFRGEPGRLWFQSHWGFQFYMEKWGATPLNTRDSEITSGDVMIVPANNVDVVPIPPERIFTPEEPAFPVFPFVSTMGLGTGAGFYSDVRGPLPWVVGRVPPEKYYIARFR